MGRPKGLFGKSRLNGKKKEEEEMLAPILNAAITAHATNLGLYGISKSTNGISIDRLKHVSNLYITTDNCNYSSGSNNKNHLHTEIFTR